MFTGSNNENRYGNEFRKLTFLINNVANNVKGLYFLDGSLLLSSINFYTPTRHMTVLGS